jgi:hypothetical protein
MEQSEVEWAIVYAELTNKIRWAISSTASQIPVNIPFRDAMSVGGEFAGTVLEILKRIHAAPNYKFSTAGSKERKPMVAETRKARHLTDNK